MNMKPEIPKHLFAVESEAVAPLLRRAARDALKSHQLADTFIATWENSSVVFVLASEISLAELTSIDEHMAEAIVADKTFDHRVLLKPVQKFYLADDGFHVTCAFESIGQFYSLVSPEFVQTLQKLCQEITGRERDIHIVLKRARDGFEFSLTIPRGETSAVEDVRRTLKIHVAAMKLDRPVLLVDDHSIHHLQENVTTSNEDMDSPDDR